MRTKRGDIGDQNAPKTKGNDEGDGHDNGRTVCRRSFEVFLARILITASQVIRYTVSVVANNEIVSQMGKKNEGEGKRGRNI